MVDEYGLKSIVSILKESIFFRMIQNYEALPCCNLNSTHDSQKAVTITSLCCMAVNVKKKRTMKKTYDRPARKL